ncbi:MAG: LytTr family transcriptional regulator [Rhodobacteraceae bacterium HLUCCA08]|nr:MAG: LytTr family transcriptional regulator [Rhodobacteraceae bacterium HLUCCA08]
MNDRPLPSALRELRADLGRPATLALLAGIAAVLTLVGAFGTDATLRPVPRLGYWLVVVAATFSAGVLSHGLVQRHLSGRLGAAGLAGVGALATAGTVSGVVLALNAAIFGHLPRADAAPGFVLTVGGIAVIVSLVVSVAYHDAGAQQSPRDPPLLERLPLDRRGALVSLSVEDHYVRVRTLKGEDMLLMRLGDAIREAAPVNGLQVHRSHWVALDQVAAARRTGDRAILTMRQGPEIPVSRSNLRALKEAGLLPR